MRQRQQSVLEEKKREEEKVKVRQKVKADCKKKNRNKISSKKIRRLVNKYTPARCLY